MKFLISYQKNLILQLSEIQYNIHRHSQTRAL